MWYDVFSLFYDGALEEAYRPFRKHAIDALLLHAGATVLDLPCGTGQSLDLIVQAVGPTGQVLGVETLGQPTVDGVICSLGLTAMPDWERVFDSVCQLVRPGGRFVIFDVFASERNRHSRAVELVARADISRRVWKPLRDHCSDFQWTVVNDDAKKFGGELYVAAGSVS